MESQKEAIFPLWKSNFSLRSFMMPEGISWKNKTTTSLPPLSKIGIAFNFNIEITKTKIEEGRKPEPQMGDEASCNSSDRKRRRFLIYSYSMTPPPPQSSVGQIMPKVPDDRRS
jgi:hypothetical protein